ncbi:universal stress protein [Actinokineospora terrae]|uniref:Nucleotide-binding universal stress protein, UspA family n=1 Tax=Actinokineospora terrae TaxID=155974 RepID=A0A1H9X256_9PSEU|nr:universal stress protein [Actinokineospora terrae]SES40220.1 Nucleotide-binding universal stress protein, UspA family [Actinokineospora terrae]
MSTTSRPPVIAAVDGSPSSTAAVAWAADEAGARGLPLHLVHVYVPPSVRYPLDGAASDELADALREQGRQWLAEAAKEAERLRPDLVVRADLLPGWPVERLLAASDGAAAVVTGHRGLNGFEGLLLGSVSDSVSAHAGCPVVVVRGTETEGGPVVVGVDGSESSAATLEFAFAEASRRGAGLVVVHAWNDSAYAGAWVAVPMVVDWDAIAEDARLAMAEVTAGFAERYPDVAVDRVVVRGRPARVLVERSAGARLVVVGRRGRRLWTGLGMGSTCRAVLHHSDCPVAVVHR